MVSFKEFLLMEEGDLDSKFSKINITGKLQNDKELLNSVENKIRGLEENGNYTYEKILSKEILFKALIGIHLKYKSNAEIFRDKEYPFIKTTYSNQNRAGKKINTIINTICKKYEDSEDIINAINGNDFHKVIEASKNEIDEVEKKQQAEEDQKNYDEAIDKIKNAKSKDDIDKIQDYIDKIPEDKQEEVQDLINQKQKELNITDEDDTKTPKPEQSQEDGNSGGNTQVSNSNISSSFSKDDWETLFKEKNEAEIEKILNKVASNTISKMEKMLNDRASQVLKDKDLMKEDAQEELWNIINERINLGNGSYLERDKGKSVNMYKDGSVGKNNDGSINAGNANDTLEHYKKEIEFMTSNVAGRIAEINGNRSFSSSDGKLNKLRNQVRSVVLDYHNELLDIKNEFDKKISKVGLFQKNKINKARQKEKDDERFNSSEQGEMYGSALKEKTNQIYNAFNSTLKRSQVKTFDDMVAKQIATLAASSMDAKSFAKSCMFKRVLAEDGKTMFVLKYLSNKGIKIPLFDGKDHKQSGLDAKAYSDAFNKFKQELADNEKYSNDSVIKNLVDAINKETPENQANDNGLKIEAALIRKALKKDVRDNNQGQQNNNQGQQNNNPPRGLRNRAEAADQEIEDNNMKNLEDNEDFDATVTTAKCDGLPIGARRYSRAIRRRMNYALNKYM